MDQVQHFAKHVELLLIHRAVADEDRMRLLVAAEARKFLLRQFELPTNAIHDLQVFAFGRRETMQPVDECTSLLRKTKHAQCIERKGGITQPGVAIVPVAYPTQVLW